MTREQGTLNREQGRGFGQLYFSLHITLREAASRLRFFSVHLHIGDCYNFLTIMRFNFSCLINDPRIALV